MPANSRRPDRPEREPAAEDAIVVAVVLRPHALAGEVMAELHTDFPERIGELASVQLQRPDGSTTPARVLAVRPTTPGRAILRIEGVSDRDEAERLRESRILVPVGEIPPLPKGAYYDFQIIGLRVVTTEGKDLGPIKEILRTGANDVYITDQVLVPAIDSVVVGIDLERGEMTIAEVEGLLD